ncbi:Tex family protein [Gammaproteobacteria bacterium AS21]
MNIAQKIADELNISTAQVSATIKLLAQGNTIPFIARYRKEVTAGLDDIQLRALAERLEYLNQLEQRRAAILKSISEQGLLNNDLKAKINDCLTKTLLEDLYLPFKLKRNSKALTAKHAGLQPLADALLAKDSCNPLYLARNYINKEYDINSPEQALENAAHIIIESLTENAALLNQLRTWLSHNGELKTKVKRGKKDPNSKFLDYFDFTQAFAKIPSHRALAIFRGVSENILNLHINAPSHNELYPVKLIEHYLGLTANNKTVRAQDYWLAELAVTTWQSKLQSQLESDLSKTLREQAQAESIDVFATNLKDILMAPPAGQKVTLGLDPGFRSGVKVAIVSATGDFLEQAVIYPHAPQNQWHQAIATLDKLITTFEVELISIGNGTASRETENLVAQLALLCKRPFISVVVSEAGASVYSASVLASTEFPNIDVSIRGAISIARRLQDPLSELVKIDPKAIGVGQYQHDVNGKKLHDKLTAITEDCVNKVGVNLNSASVTLLSNVAGINQSIAENIVHVRETTGKYTDRKALLAVPRLGAKAYQQCAGFLRLDNPTQPLDSSAVHPESYPLVEKIAEQLNISTVQLIANHALLSTLDSRTFIDKQYGQYTVDDVIAELAKPGRDPRPQFKTVTFDKEINKVSDLRIDMTLEGVVTNVTNFGAFVDIGVHQDGLVHISQLANTFVSDPHKIVKTGQIVNVKVLEIDDKRNRIALSMKR